jgi:phosphohistidine phosphatase
MILEALEMRLYLVQHGVAKSKAEDPERPLTEIGVKETNEIAEYISKTKIATVNKIYHSGKTRAQETAQIFTGFLNPSGGLNQADGLAPMDDPKIWFNKLEGMGQEIMLVGHLPHLTKLTALAISKNQNTEPVRFRNSGVVCLEKEEGQSDWILRWMVIPELVVEKEKY